MEAYDAVAARVTNRGEASIQSCGLSHRGRVRSNNEDSYAVEPDMDLFVVADGMGGAQAGERASRITVDTVVEEIRQVGDEAGVTDLVDAVHLANKNVRWEAEQNPELAGMGTTVVAVLLRPPKAYIVNVGDSRAYLQTGGELYCVTSDNSWVNEVGRGLGLTEEQLRNHPYRNVLTRAVGAEENIQSDTLEIDFLPGDVVLLCSDGLHGVAGERSLLRVLEGDQSLDEKARGLIDAALENGAPDNITAVLIENRSAEPQEDETEPVE